MFAAGLLEPHGPSIWADRQLFAALSTSRADTKQTEKGTSRELMHGTQQIRSKPTPNSSAAALCALLAGPSDRRLASGLPTTTLDGFRLVLDDGLVLLKGLLDLLNRRGGDLHHLLDHRKSGVRDVLEDGGGVLELRRDLLRLRGKLHEDRGLRDVDVRRDLLRLSGRLPM